MNASPVRRFSLAVILSMMPAAVEAAPGDLDLSFNPNADGHVWKAIESDRKILIGGYFITVGGESRNHVARLNIDGTLDASFNPDANNPATLPQNTDLRAVSIQADGKIIIGGNFTRVGGITRNSIARLNANGTLDTDFNPDVHGELRSIAIQTNNEVVIAGGFGTVGAVNRNGIARVYSDGTLDTGLNPDAGNSEAICTVIQNDGKIVVGGKFDNIGGVTRNHIARLRLDGALDAGFNPDVNNAVWTAAIQADGKLLIGGFFTTVGGVPREYLARLNTDGTLDAEFNPVVDNWIFTTAIQSDGKIIIGGYFTKIGGVSRNHVARLNADGTVDTSFITDVDSKVWSTTIQSDGKIILGGQFSKVNGQPRNAVVRLHNDPQSQILTGASNSKVKWMRGGSAPEVSRVTFDRSTDGGTSWFNLGTGTRVPGGWELTGINLTGTESVRARGRTTGGFANGSQSFAEIVATLPPFADITVEHPTGTVLQSGVATIDFGPVVTGSSGTKQINIRSTGTGDLSGLAATKSAGGTPGDFTISALAATTVPRDASTTFDVTFFPTGAGVRTATLQIASNDPDEGPFIISLSGSQATSLEAWRQQHFGSPYNTETGADLNDPDGDGIFNLMEYAAGSDPKAFSPPPGQLVKTGDTLEFTYSRPKAALEELSYGLEAGSSLTGVWNKAGITTTILSDDGATQQVKVITSAGSLGKRFVRLRVTRL